MARLRWTLEAETWLKDIFDYIAQDNPAAAERLIRKIYQKAQLLIDHPKMGYLYRNGPEGEIRVLLYGHYRIAYLCHDSVETIDVLGVFHGALDIERYMP